MEIVNLPHHTAAPGVPANKEGKYVDHWGASNFSEVLAQLRSK